MYIVDVKESNREKFIKMFENEGFEIEEKYTRESILKSVLPITLDFEIKKMGRMGNVTCTCVALKYGMIKNEGEFLNNIKCFI